MSCQNSMMCSFLGNSQALPAAVANKPLNLGGIFELGVSTGKMSQTIYSSDVIVMVC